MKKILVSIVFIIIGIAIGLMVTMPDRQQHQDTIKSVMQGAINAELRENQIDGPLGAIASVAAYTTLTTFLNTSFVVRDHTFYSLGFIDYEGEFILVSVGVFNHVYTLDEDQARKLIKQKMKTLAL